MQKGVPLRDFVFIDDLQNIRYPHWNHTNLVALLKDQIKLTKEQKKSDPIHTFGLFNSPL